MEGDLILGACGGGIDAPGFDHQISPVAALAEGKKRLNSTFNTYAKH